MKLKINIMLGEIALLSVLLFSSFLLAPETFAQESKPSSDIPEIISTTFLFPRINSGSVLKGNFNIKVKVPYTQDIEADLTPENSKAPLLATKAKKLENDYWSVSFTLENIPDGVYYLSAKIKNVYGEFETGKTKVIVDNSSRQNSKAITQKEIDEWEAELASEDSSSIQEDVDNFLDSMLTPEWLDEYFHATSCSNKTICGSQADPDKDGLVNLEEFRLRTNPVKVDTDGDGYNDGDEIKNGYDPLKYSPGHADDKINFQSPKENGQVQADIYKIMNVISTETTEKKTGLTMSGTGLPNSFVNIFVYSSPTILTIKTDNSGNWSYTLDKNVEDGKHQVYVAVTDNEGKITAKSEPLFFVKRAAAISIIPPSEASSMTSPAETRQNTYMIISIIIAGIALLLSLVIIGIKKTKTIKNEPEQFQ